MDQELAILALRNEIKNHTSAEFVDEESKASDSENSKIEAVVRRIQEQLRAV